MKYQKMIKEASDQITDRLKNSKNVLGIFLVGSAAKGGFDVFSDIDFFVVLKKSKKVSREAYVNDRGIGIEVLYNTLEEVEGYLKKDKASLHRNTSDMLAGGSIIYQTSPEVSQLQQKARTNLKTKTKSKKVSIIMQKYSLQDFLHDAKRDVEKKDVFAFNLDGNFLVQNAIELLLEKNGTYQRKSQEMSVLLKKIDEKFFNCLKRYYETSSLDEKLKQLECLKKYIEKQYGGQLPPKWSLPSK
jgi:hypothetical protein